MEDDTNFPEYGEWVELIRPWRGHHNGIIIGRSGYKFIVQLSSGVTIELYGDEFEIME